MKNTTIKTVLESTSIRLEQAAASHKTAAEEMKYEFFACGEPIINGSALLDQLPFDIWLRHTEENFDPETVQKDWAVSTTFFAIRQSDGKLLGMIDVRHELSVPFLQEYGGHIGYAVRPTERKKGYATEMLQLALSYCARLNIPVVRLGCYAENIASVRTIEHCGGTCIEQKTYTDGKPMLIYQINMV
ncbi:MAG: GNAT family N-acetyltransferase [Ruminiclostridium sp.]|jgi:predicted acetyltransferase|nr:GNAT family N-acetyltransferase [Ruminiclostridium sp.]